MPGPPDSDARLRQIITLLDDDVRLEAAARLRWRPTEDRNAYETDLDEYVVCVALISETFSRDRLRLSISREGVTLTMVADTGLDRITACLLYDIFEHARRWVLRLGGGSDDDAIEVEIND
jgi:hypothetical protein